MTTIADPAELQEPRELPQGLIMLVTELIRRYGAASLKPASLQYALEQNAGAFELRVPREQMDEASIFATELTVKIEEALREYYTVLVLPSD